MERTQHMRALTVFIRNYYSPADHGGDFGMTNTIDFSVTQMKLERHKGNRPQMLLNFLHHRRSLHRSTIIHQQSTSHVISGGGFRGSERVFPLGIMQPQQRRGLKKFGFLLDTL